MVGLLGSGARWLFAQPYLLLSLMALFWAFNIVLGRLVAGHVPPMAMSFVRWAGAFLLVLPFTWRQLAQDWPQIRKHFAFMTLLSITGISAYNTMAYYGLQYTQAINGLLIQSTLPLFVALWSFALFGDRLSLAQAAGIALSLAGVVVIICRGDLGMLLGIGVNRGDLWFLLGLLIFGAYSALLRRRPPIQPLSFLTFTMGYGSLWLIPLFAAEAASGYRLSFDWITLSTLAYMAFFPSVLSYLFFNRGVELIGANRSAPFTHLAPLFGSALAIVMLGERPQLFHVIGYALVLGGITIATRWARANA
jgi:drug/metabolite transporter (DMT)-like permease